MFCKWPRNWAQSVSALICFMWIITLLDFLIILTEKSLEFPPASYHIECLVWETLRSLVKELWARWLCTEFTSPFTSWLVPSLHYSDHSLSFTKTRTQPQRLQRDCIVLCGAICGHVPLNVIITSRIRRKCDFSASERKKALGWSLTRVFS